MEWDEYTRHAHRRELIKCVGDLTDAQRGLTLATEHIKYFGSAHPLAMDIEQNLDALRQGIADTLAIAGHLAKKLQDEMTEPYAKPPPVSANCGPVMTPLQRMLAREGVVFNTLPKYEPTKQEARLPKILPVRLTKPVRKKRTRDKDNPPL